MAASVWPVATDGTARESVSERQTTQHVNERMDTVSAWLTGSFTLLLDQPWSHQSPRDGLTSLTVSCERQSERVCMCVRVDGLL